MKKAVIFLFTCLSAFALDAQEQIGVVKAIGRPDKPGTPIADVLVRAQEGQIASASDEEGVFSISLGDFSEGDAYKISSVTKSGFRLADPGLIGRELPYSSHISLEISMVSNADYYRTKREIEDKILARIEKEYQSRLEALEKQLKEKQISEKVHVEKLTELEDYYNNSSNLIEELSDRYARTDYDTLDSLDREIISCIESGLLEEAEELLSSKGTKEALEQQIKENALMLKNLEEGKNLENKLKANYASELIMRFDIAMMKFDNVSAAECLKERMGLDERNFDWRMDYATFIRDYLGMYEEAMEIYRSILNESNLESSIEASIYGCMGNVYDLRSEYDLALESYLRCAEIREKDPHLIQDLPTAYSNISKIYFEKEMNQQALDYVAKAERLFVEQSDSLGLSGVYTSLGAYYSKIGNFKLSEENLKRALEIRLKVEGPNGRGVASVYSNLATLAKELNNYEEAEANVDKALTIYKTIYGESHPRTAEEYLSLGSIKVAKGDYNDALQYYEGALNILKDFYGEIHSSICQAYNHLANYYSNIVSDFDKAEDYYFKSLDVAKAIHGEIHSEVAISLHNCAYIMSSKAKYAEALELYYQALEINKQLYGDNHYTIADTYTNISLIYYKQQKYEESLAGFLKCYQLYKEFYGANHTTIALTHSNLAGVYSAIGNDQTALEHLGKAVDIYRNILGNDHIRVGDVYNEIGCIYLNHKMYDDAEKYLLEALRIRLKVNGEAYEGVAESYNNLSQLYVAKGDIDKAKNYLENAIKLKIQVYGERHPDVAIPVANLASLYFNIGNFKLATQYLQYAYDIFDEVYLDSSENLNLYAYRLGEFYEKIQEYDKALEYLEKSYDFFLENSGPDNYMTRKSFFLMNMCYFNIMSAESYSREVDADFENFNKNLAIIATVTSGSLAEKLGLAGAYQVIAFEKWSIENKKTNFLAYSQTVPRDIQKTYVLYRDGEFVKVNFEGALGVSLEVKWISVEEKESLIREYKKWKRKNR